MKTAADTPDDAWTDRLRQTLARYDEALLRKVAAALLQLRSQKTAAELIDRMAAAMSNPVAIDRRLQDLDPPSRTVLALIGQSRQPRWRLRQVLELLQCTGLDGLGFARQLLEMGFLYPELPEGGPQLRSFDGYLTRLLTTESRVFAHPGVTARVLRLPLDLPPLGAAVAHAGGEREADGLELFLRLGVLWQQVKQQPLRLTQQGEFFKKDQDRLSSEALLTSPAVDELAALPQIGPFLVTMGLATGQLHYEDAQLTAGELPPWWGASLPAALGHLWAALPEIEAWNAVEGGRGLSTTASPYASAGLLALVLLSRLPEGQWSTPAAVGAWLAEHHCFWRGQTRQANLDAWTASFLLGLAYPLRLVQAAKAADAGWVVRLSSTGRGVMGLAPLPEPMPYPKTLLVQPNLEIVVYRQGLTPGLIADLTRFGAWTSLGAACTLQLQPETVYRGLEAGLTFESMRQMLQQHGVRETPTPVIQLLRTWADKRERLAVYPSATLLEFHTPEELQEALGRGLPGTRISDRLVLVAHEEAIDFRHFRLLGTRDYGRPPDQCVSAGTDGVTLAVDVARSDLLLETEIQRFADSLPTFGSNGQRLYRLTPASLTRGRQSGLSLPGLEEWFRQRTGQPLPPAARLLLVGADTPTMNVRRLLVLHVPSAVLADGLMQWPESRLFIQSRLGPLALSVAEEDVEKLRALLRQLRLQIHLEGSSSDGP